MTVKELIEKLKEYPEDAIVVRDDCERPSELRRLGEGYKTERGLWSKEFYDRAVEEKWEHVPKILGPAIYLY